MKLRSLPLLSALALAGLAATACSNTSPATPTEVAATPANTGTGSVAVVTDGSTGVSVGAPTPASPADGAQFKYVEQPVKLIISNGVTTGSTALTYTFEVATDTGFASKVYTKEVSEGSNGQTSVTIDKLPASKTYYWRARSNVAGGGPYSRSRSFIIGPEVILQTPTLAVPAQGATVTGRTATLTVNNVGRTGPAERVTYRFELSDSASFGNLLFVSSVPEQSGGQTSVQVTTTSTVAATYFWRVQASDPPNLVTTAFSQTSAFKYEPFSMRDATIWDNPPDLASWEETATITSIDMDDYIVVDFDKRTGPGRWPESGFGSGGIQYTLGMCLNINAHWHCSAAIQFWEGRELTAGGPPGYIAANWFYDARWGTMAGHQPDDGELVGFFVAQGNLRDSGQTSVKERSNVALVPFGSSYRASAARVLRGVLGGLRLR